MKEKGTEKLVVRQNPNTKCVLPKNKYLFSLNRPSIKLKNQFSLKKKEEEERNKSFFVCDIKENVRCKN